MVALRKAVLSATASLIAIGTGAVAPAFAQEATPADPGLSTNDPIIVTGTRITAPDVESAAPISFFTAEDIESSGKTNLASLLAEDPALVGTITSQRSAGAAAPFGMAGTNLLNLRNLGTERTLVLVNGRRHVSTQNGTAAVDINTIPVSLVERVDVLTGGVSAVYGADGVSGVVNFVMKRDFDGLEARAQTGISSRGDAEEYLASLTAGRNFASGAGNVSVAYEYRRSERLRGEERRSGNPEAYEFLIQNQADLADDPSVPDNVPLNDLRYLFSSPLGAIDVNFDAFPDFNGNGDFYDFGTFLFNSGFLAQGGEGTPIAGYSGDLLPEVETHNLNILANYEFSPAFRVFVEGKYVSSESYTEGQPTFDIGSFLYLDNPYLPAIAATVAPYPAVGVFRDHFDFGRRAQRTERETWRGVIGAEGEISDHLSYEVSYTYGKTEIRIDDINNRIRDRYYAALDAVDDGTGNVVCRSDLNPFATYFDFNYGGPPVTFTPGASGCSPINILGSNVASDAALSFFMADLTSRVELEQHVVSGSLSGDFGGSFELPGGPVRFAVGGEYRDESSSFSPDQQLQDGVILDIAQVVPQKGGFDVWEAFAEVQLPVLRDVQGAELLQFGAAVRLSDYSTAGSTTAWKIDGVYAPVADVQFRASYSQSVRAPNINEIFAPTQGVANFIVDPCDISNVDAGSSARQANCTAILSDLGVDPTTFNPSNDPFASTTIFGTSSGNPDVREEKAKTWTAGVVLAPAALPRLKVSLDWYDIRLKGAINAPTAQEFAELCVDQPSLDNQFCPNISRNSATGYINGFSVMPANVSRFRAAGADFKISYDFEPSATMGQFSARVSGGYLDRLSFIATPGASSTVEKKEPYAPEWTGTFDLAWTKGAVSANYGISYFSKTRRYSLAELAADPDISDPRYFFYKKKWEHDVHLSADVFDDRVTVYGGVNNLFDSKPALGLTAYPVNPRGRFFYFGMKARLGS